MERDNSVAVAVSDQKRIVEFLLEHGIHQQVFLYLTYDDTVVSERLTAAAAVSSNVSRDVLQLILRERDMENRRTTKLRRIDPCPSGGEFADDGIEALSKIGYNTVHAAVSSVDDPVPVRADDFDRITAFHALLRNTLFDKPSLGVTVLLINMAKYCARRVWPLFVNDFSLIREFTDIEKIVATVRYEDGRKAAAPNSSKKTAGNSVDVLRMPRTLAQSKKYGVTSFDASAPNDGNPLRYSSFGRLLKIMTTAPFDMAAFREIVSPLHVTIRDSIFAFSWFTRSPREMTLLRDLPGSLSRASCRYKPTFLTEIGSPINSQRFSHFFVFPKHATWFAFETTTRRLSFSRFITRSASEAVSRLFETRIVRRNEFHHLRLCGFMIDDKLLSVYDLQSTRDQRSFKPATDWELKRFFIEDKMQLHCPWERIEKWRIHATATDTQKRRHKQDVYAALAGTPNIVKFISKD